MIEIIRTQGYADWLRGLDANARGRIIARVAKFEATGHAGDIEPVGNGVSEMRIHFGPGYRIYFIVLKKTVILIGGDKSTQTRDIRKVKELADHWRDQKL